MLMISQGLSGTVSINVINKNYVILTLARQLL